MDQPAVGWLEFVAFFQLPNPDLVSLLVPPVAKATIADRIGQTPGRFLISQNGVSQLHLVHDGSPGHTLCGQRYTLIDLYR